MAHRVDAHNLKPLHFWKQYISQRQPAVIADGDSSWMQQFNDDVLLERVGDVTVEVELRGNSSENYGQGKKISMPMRQLIQARQQGNSSLYMSTQEVGVGRDGHPLLLGPPLLQLTDVVPLQQPLMGHLVPQSINMWMGCAPQGSTTGLHHDYHDNLYVLLRGCKRFRLFPPSTAPDMYVTGSIKKIYPNGRIVYAGQGDVNADGSDANDVKLWQARQKVDDAAAAAAAPSSRSAELSAEAQLESRLEQLLDEAALCNGDDFVDDYVADREADCSTSDDDGRGDADGDLHGSTQLHWTPQQQGTAAQAAGQSAANKRRKRSLAAGSSSSVPPAAGEGKAGTAALTAATPPPPSFSQVNLSLPQKKLQVLFPRFPGLAAALEVVLQEGDMLYLPAGWFHEVSSHGAGGLNGGHLAINYWYHPPDNLDSSKAGFRHPYTSSYYPTLWANRQAWLQQDTLNWWQHKQQLMLERQQRRHAGQQECTNTTAAAAQHDGASKPRARAQKRCVMWHDDVLSPTNKYHVSMTKSGTASGDVDRLPGDASRLPAKAMVADESDTPADSPDSATSKRFRSDDSGDEAAGGSHMVQGDNVEGSKQQQQQQADEVFPSSISEPGDVPTGEQQRTSDRSSSEHSQDARRPGMSTAVLDGMAALDAYFSGNSEAANALVKEFLRQRRRRMAISSRQSEAAVSVALPILWGRRHHYTTSVALVKRTPAKQ